MPLVFLGGVEAGGNSLGCAVEGWGWGLGMAWVGWGRKAVGVERGGGGGGGPGCPPPQKKRHPDGPLDNNTTKPITLTTLNKYFPSIAQQQIKYIKEWITI